MIPIWQKIADKIQGKMSFLNRTNSPSIKQILNHYGPGDNIAGDKVIIEGKPPERHLIEELKTKLILLIPLGSSVDIRYLTTDREAFIFATEIKSFIEEKYKIINFLGAMYNPPFIGIQINPPNTQSNPSSNYVLCVGSNA